jgi:uncharacterized protein
MDDRLPNLADAHTPAAHVAEPPGPATSDRLAALDLLRGVAVLGILVMNVQSFSMPDQAYFNPSVYGDLSGINLVVWVGSALLFELKFMAVFSMLFGAGVVLFCTRAERRGARAARLHYRRTAWLLVFGVLHAYLLWMGDILVWYSLSAFVAYLFWRMRPGWLLAWGLALLAFHTAIYAFFSWSLPYWPAEAVEEVTRQWSPPPEVVERQLEAYRGGWLAQMPERAAVSASLHTFAYAIWGVWRTLGCMLLGMALFRWGVLSGERPTAFYVRGAVAGLVVGLPLVAWGISQNFSHAWSVSYSMFAGTLPNYWGSLPVAFAWISVVMLAFRLGWLAKAQRVLAEVGRMAFSSYILQTLVCTTLFYGHGLGLYGHVPRWGQLLVVLGTWVIVVAFARMWLARFRFGPLEWLWRSLTYGRRQPMRATAGAQA